MTTKPQTPPLSGTTQALRALVQKWRDEAREPEVLNFMDSAAALRNHLAKELEAALSSESGADGGREVIAWAILLEGELCDTFMNKDQGLLEFKRRNRLYPEPTREFVELVRARTALHEGGTTTGRDGK